MFFEIREMKKLIYDDNQLKNTYIMLLENVLKYCGNFLLKAEG